MGIVCIVVIIVNVVFRRIRYCKHLHLYVLSKVCDAFEYMTSTMNNVWWDKENLVPLKAPTSIFVVGVSGSGKGYLTREILKHADGMLKKTVGRVMFCYGVCTIK